MDPTITKEDLLAAGSIQSAADKLVEHIKATLIICPTAEQAWQELAPYLLTNHYPFSVHHLVFTSLFPDWLERPELAPVWMPSIEQIANANITKIMADFNMADVKEFQQWASQDYAQFWQRMTQELNIIFKELPTATCDMHLGVTRPSWFPHAKMNLVDSCFNAHPQQIAIIEGNEAGEIKTLTYQQLQNLVNGIANSLIQQGFGPGDAIAVIMPMHHHAVAIYLAIIKIGGIVVSIADSFSSQEIATRVRITHTKAIFTQDHIQWDKKQIPLYTKLCGLKYPEFADVTIIVLPAQSHLSTALSEHAIAWESFYIANPNFESQALDPMTACNILFSSGTTAEPKAIVWNHTTGIKAASDAFFHQNIQAGDVLAWPTNLGWMMGPWLIYAALINKASIALFTGAPKSRSYGEFINKAQVTMLGVVPTLVASWRVSKCMEGLDWSAIKVLTSTGECSNAEDMFYLMYLSGYKPVIEYCGGTEIGGAYVSSTVVQNNYPSLFSTPTMGLDFVILNEAGKEADIGEVAIIPPCIGLSTTLLNANHDHVYFANMPSSASGKILRRHGDMIKRYENGYYSVLGRVDDAMNLGGIKISAAEIERALSNMESILETAAIAITEGHNGPSQLVIFVVSNKQFAKEPLLKEMQMCINRNLNPLFKIHDIVIVQELPKTASNKIMRRKLREMYQGVK